MTPTDREINDTLRRLEQMKIELIDEWQSDAQKKRLPIVNLTHSGAPLLDRDEVLRRSYPNHARRER